MKFVIKKVTKKVLVSKLVAVGFHQIVQQFGHQKRIYFLHYNLLFYLLF